MNTITKDNLTIHIYGHHYRKAITHAMSQQHMENLLKPKTRDGRQSKVKCINNNYASSLNEKDYVASLQKMLDIIDMLEQGTLPIDIFDYLHKTKAGTFKKKSTIILATCAYGMVYNDTDTIVSHVLQLKLVTDKTGEHADIEFECSDLDTTKDIVVFEDMAHPKNPTHVTIYSIVYILYTTYSYTLSGYKI